MRQRGESCTAPCSGDSSPAIARNRVDLPEPLRPISPTRAPVGICADAWSSSRRPATRDGQFVDHKHGPLFGRARRREAMPNGVASSSRQGQASVACRRSEGGRHVRARMSGSGPDALSRHTLRGTLVAKAGACDGRCICRDGGGAVVRRGRATAGANASSISRTRCRRISRPSTARPASQLQKLKDLKKDGYNLYRWRLNEHSGTHLDAPIHFSEAGMTAEQIAAETLVVPLAVINVADKAAKDPDYRLSRDRSRRMGTPARAAAGQLLRRHEFRLGAACRRHGKIRRQGCRWRDAFSRRRSRRDAWLIKQRKVAGLAVDTLSLDPRRVEGFQDARAVAAAAGAGAWRMSRTSTACRRNGATLVVGLAKVKGATGGPARLFALV